MHFALSARQALFIMLSMMVAQSTAFGPAAAAVQTPVTRAPAAAMFGKSDLEALAKEQVLAAWAH